MGRPITPIKVGEKEKKLWKETLLSYYKERGDIQESDISGLIEQKIKESEAGWEGAPRSFRDRLMRKTGYGMQAALMGKARGAKAKKVTKEVPSKPKIDLQFYDFDRVLKLKEKKWWVSRQQAYAEDFEFNNSSDYVLLQQLLIEELVQRRLAIKQIENPDETSYSRLISESLKRLHNLQTKLGITREQRADELDAMDGNVAVLSVMLDEKLKEIDKIQDEQEKEEKYYTALHNQRDVVNILPPQEKIGAILGINDDGTADLIDKKIDISKQIEKLHKKTLEKNEPQISEHKEDKDTSDEI
jgi:hypothetical protein